MIPESVPWPVLWIWVFLPALTAANGQILASSEDSSNGSEPGLPANITSITLITTTFATTTRNGKDEGGDNNVADVIQDEVTGSNLTTEAWTDEQINGSTPLTPSQQQEVTSISAPPDAGSVITAPAPTVVGIVDATTVSDTATPDQPEESTPITQVSGAPDAGIDNGTTAPAFDDVTGVTTTRPSAEKRNETIATTETPSRPEHTAPPGNESLANGNKTWMDHFSDCWAFLVAVSVAAVIIIAVVLIVALHCIKPSRNFSVAKPSGSTELTSVNGPTEYNTTEPPGVMAEVLAPESFTNLALTD